MRSPGFIHILVFLLLSVHAAAQPVGTTVPRTGERNAKPQVEIRVLEGGWGEARTEDIETVLHSVAGVLLEPFPGRHLNAILVAHTDRHPLTLFERGPQGEYQVYLSARGRHWAHYAYEFAHELSHILSNYEHFALSEAATGNQWFVEALCEAASLYALKRIAYVWEVSPPHPRWRAHALTFAEFAQRLINERHRRLPPGTSLAAWFEQKERDLRRNPYLRAHNEVVANVLLPLFEDNPEIWRAIAHLPATGARFRDYLSAWRANAPEDCRGFITYVMTLFGMQGGGGQATTPSLEVPAAEITFTPALQPF
jgi:hypothetical protein